MEPVPFIIASVVGTSLVAAILALWRAYERDKKNRKLEYEKDKQEQIAANKRCEGRGERLESEINATKGLVIELYKENAKAAELRAAEAVKSALQMAETAKICARVLKRYEQTPIPSKMSDEESDLFPVKKG
jgi:hypothetical protein